jgi:16S rRNA (guanine966-N2)-methyltransferase
MRVVAGTARGRRLQAPVGDVARPTADRVREATFNALGSLGVIEDSTVLDLFAGSGALGIEALSRGATSATFVDDDNRSLVAVRANLVSTGLADRATVVRSEAQRFLGAGRERFDLVLLDPPYAFADEDWTALLGAVATVEADVVVVESDRAVPVPDPWRVLRAKKYGSTVVTIARRG